MPHSRHRSWIEIQKKLAGFHHPAIRNEHDTDWTPNADVIEHADGILVRLELAGVALESIQIAVANSTLLVTGKRMNPNTGGTAAGYRFRQMEIEYGPFERVLPLPYPVDHQHVRARCGNGILEISMLRSATIAKRKTIIHIKW
jgi:HSP20 family protein